MNKRLFVLAVSVLVPLAACEGFKEAMTAHVDVVAQAGGQELSVTRLSDLLGKSEAPLRKDVVKTVADLWVNYQLLGRAAAEGDSLMSPKLIDEAMWPAITGNRTKKLYEAISKDWGKVDSTKIPEAYARGDLLAARHILFRVQKDSAAKDAQMLKQANTVRATLTAANFAAMATKYNEPNAAGPGGDLGVFPHGAMVKDFEQAVLALKPGDISQPIRSDFGYHIIRRSTYDEVKQQFDQAYAQRATQSAESAFVARLESANKVEVKPNAAAAMKAYAVDPEGKANDKTVIATSVLGNFTVARAGEWIDGFQKPPPAQIRQQMQTVPDSLLGPFVKQLVRNDLLLHMADSAKIQIDTTELNELRHTFVTVVTNSWSGLGVAPRQLADSAKTVSERERLAAARIEDYLNRLVTKGEQFVNVPVPVVKALHKKYDSKVNPAAVDKALERAQKVRLSADSAKKASQPASAVPMPGAAVPQTVPPQPAVPKIPPAKKP
jgi:parvulin-like peptidyl-prolyl isomerase